MKFLLENARNIIFVVVFFGSLFALGVRLYTTPDKVEALEENVRVLQTKQEMFELRFSTLEQNFIDIKEDMKEIKSDIKLLLRTK